MEAEQELPKQRVRARDIGTAQARAQRGERALHVRGGGAQELGTRPDHFWRESATFSVMQWEVQQSLKKAKVVRFRETTLNMNGCRKAKTNADLTSYFLNHHRHLLNTHWESSAVEEVNIDSH